MNAQEDFSISVKKIIQKDHRYKHNAYFFLRDALEFTVKGHNPNQLLDKGHISGRALLDGIRKFAIEQYGPLTITVFDDWGVKSCEDFGEIVFNLVEVGILGMSDKDSKEEFKNAYAFKEAFLKPFQPIKKTKTPLESKKKTNKAKSSPSDN